MNSNFPDIKKPYWSQTLFLSISIVLFILFSLELHLRQQGFEPSISDDRNLWSIERNKVTSSHNEIVFIGSSRSRTNVAINEFERLAPNYKIIQLSVDSSCANEALRDLSEQTEFNGIVVTEITEECILFGEEPDLSISSLVEYRKTDFTLTQYVNKKISIFFQKNFVVMDPYFSFYKVIVKIILGNNSHTPRYWTTYENRSQNMDYSKLDLESYSKKRIEYVKRRMKSLEPSISFEQFHRNFLSLEIAIDNIQKNGGQVVLAFFPMGKERWDINEYYFPKRKFWEIVNKNSKAVCIHYKDFPSLSQYNPPDESHLDFREKKSFTKDLYDVLITKKVVQLD